MMLPLTIKACVRTLLFMFTISLANGQDRRIKPELHPGCKTCTDKNILVYIRAEGDNDTIHQIWDFTMGTPTVIFTVASVHSTLNITWEDNKPVNFTLNETPIYSFATIIDRLVEYDDVEDKGHIDERYPRREHELSQVSWELRDSVLSDQEAVLRVHGHYRRGWGSGIVDFKLDMVPYRDYASELPHLIHSGNSSLVDVRLVNVTSPRAYNASRLALRLVLLATDRGALHSALRKSLDDEHTPGVFEIIEIKSPLSFSGGSGAFLQFRPVAYSEPERSVSSSTNAYITGFNTTSLASSKTTLAAFYRGYKPSDLLTETAYISFGMPGDGFYKQHNFTAWSFTVGYGQPPIERFSLLVVVIISVGLALPVLLALAGALLVAARRCGRAHPQPLLDDD